ncbi:MAG TPA: hypothetical protein V6C81_04410 [Planktothrix sp.]|jgi:hypothetical protein
MTIEAIKERDSGIEEGLDSPFSSKRWLAYFEDNKNARVAISFPPNQSVPIAVVEPLLKSLQRFQIGETGEGNHLRRCARTLNDPRYDQCIDLFIKEEQFHARVLADMIGSLNGTLLTWHWTDLAFIGLRRMLHLKTEIFVLLIAEVIGKCFYRLCADRLQNNLLSDAFSLVVLDEIGHLEFHCSFLRSHMQHLPTAIRYTVCYLWAALFYAACLIFIADHAPTIKALGTTNRKFLSSCTDTFNRSAARALDLK